MLRRGGTPERTPEEEKMKGNRIAVIAGVIVVVVVLGFLALRGIWPPKSGTEGTIGAAQRYTAQQISDQDVTLQDPQVQAFLQSDTFHQLATNPDFKQWVEGLKAYDAVRNSQAANLVSQAADDLRKFKFSEKATAALADADFAKFSAPQIEALFSTESLRLLEDLRFREMLKTEAFRTEAATAQAGDEMKRRLAPKKFGAYSDALDALNVKCPDYLAMLADAGFGRWIENANARELLDQFVKVGNDNLAQVLADKDARMIITDRGFQKLENLQVFTDALKMEGLKTLLGSKVDLATAMKLSD
jgi:hypothetical protein